MLFVWKQFYFKHSGENLWVPSKVKDMNSEDSVPKSEDGGPFEDEGIKEVPE
jgi:hypothetical protein